ncbi:unnamed protein product [Peronospora belbahrii]|uniref:Protein kinase domain-containing protein n=1 Tax=Peronospora belbahrii TaxID=622444 RepID=A0AAU9KR32_9STRA|nr:unnamed protein product [Peronospora belbahrii]CAH0519916.1 unnamed protein product [Peronospora belbahrii]
MQTLVEGQTLLHNGRYRFLRRIGSGTFAVIMRALDVQQQRHVAIKCVREHELNALGKREAAILKTINNQDMDKACAVVRLLKTFEEQGHFCLVLELLGPPVLDVGRWGPWRQAPPGKGRVPIQTLQLFKRKRRRSLLSNASIQSLNGQQQDHETDVVRDDVAVLTPPMSLVDVRCMAVHLCGALAFLHDQGLIHADVKPENVVRSSAEAPLGSLVSLSPCSSPVKLVDFGNCLNLTELVAYIDERPREGYDVQTVTYRAPEVAAGLLLCSAMDMWSLGCLLLECVSGRPLFTLPPLDAPVQERTDIANYENSDLLKQIECVVTNGVSLDTMCAPYQSVARYEERSAVDNKSAGFHRKPKLLTPLQVRLEAAAPEHHQFHDFIYSLLDVNPATRVTAKQALYHPFLQAYFPFGTVFAQSNAGQCDGELGTIADIPSAAVADKKRKVRQTPLHGEQAQGLSDRVRKRMSTERAALARTKDLRQVLKIIPRDIAGRFPLSPR